MNAKKILILFFQYDPGSQQFDTSSKQRAPAYTDRILYKAKSLTANTSAFSGLLLTVTYLQHCLFIHRYTEQRLFLLFLYHHHHLLPALFLGYLGSEQLCPSSMTFGITTYCQTGTNDPDVHITSRNPLIYFSPFSFSNKILFIMPIPG